VNSLKRGTAKPRGGCILYRASSSRDCGHYLLNWTRSGPNLGWRPGIARGSHRGQADRIERRELRAASGASLGPGGARVDGCIRSRKHWRFMIDCRERASSNGRRLTRRQVRLSRAMRVSPEPPVRGIIHHIRSPPYPASDYLADHSAQADRGSRQPTTSAGFQSEDLAAFSMSR